jgi:hypothetical protein
MVRSELARILDSSQFQNSKRYPALLRYVVEQALEGNTDLKERTLGIEVFGREADYDSNADPVVRVTAGEVRKRLAQYYHDLHETPPCEIELPSGSYVPDFRKVLHRSRSKSAHLSSLPEPKPNAIAEIPAQVSEPEPERPVAAQASRMWILTGAALAILLAGAAWYGFRASKPSPASIVEKFWGPVLRSPGDALLCIGDVDSFKLLHPRIFQIYEPGAPVLTPEAPSGGLPNDSRASLADVSVMLKMASILQRYGKNYRMISSFGSNLTDLRQGPVVLIGAHNNRWTLRLTQDLRFYTLLDETGGYILDRRNPSMRDWSLPIKGELRQAEDHALIARIKDPTTGRPVIIIAGLALQGNTAAGELVSTPEYLAALLKDAPPNWTDMNLEAVIKTQVIDGKSGPPQVVAVYYW